MSTWLGSSSTRSSRSGATQGFRTWWRRLHGHSDAELDNGRTEAINGRLEAPRRNALGFRNLTHYRIRSLLHCCNLTHLTTRT